MLGQRRRRWPSIEAALADDCREVENTDVILEYQVTVTYLPW